MYTPNPVPRQGIVCTLQNLALRLISASARPILESTVPHRMMPVILQVFCLSSEAYVPFKKRLTNAAK
jgi:hypothetical protein